MLSAPAVPPPRPPEHFVPLPVKGVSFSEVNSRVLRVLIIFFGIPYRLVPQGDLLMFLSTLPTVTIPLLGLPPRQAFHPVFVLHRLHPLHRFRRTQVVRELLLHRSLLPPLRRPQRHNHNNQHTRMRRIVNCIMRSHWYIPLVRGCISFQIIRLMVSSFLRRQLGQDHGHDYKSSSCR